MKKTITKTFTETFEIEVNFPMFVKNESFSSTWIYALLSEEEYIEVAVGKNINAVKTLYLPVDRYIDFPQITEEEFLKA